MDTRPNSSIRGVYDRCVVVERRPAPTGLPARGDDEQLSPSVRLFERRDDQYERSGLDINPRIAVAGSHDSSHRVAVWPAIYECVRRRRQQHVSWETRVPVLSFSFDPHCQAFVKSSSHVQPAMPRDDNTNTSCGAMSVSDRGSMCCIAMTMHTERSSTTSIVSQLESSMRSCIISEKRQTTPPLWVAVTMSPGTNTNHASHFSLTDRALLHACNVQQPTL